MTVTEYVTTDEGRIPLAEYAKNNGLTIEEARATFAGYAERIEHVPNLDGLLGREERIRIAGWAGSDGHEDREEYCRRMVAEGLVVVVPADDELQIDIDEEAQYDQFIGQLDRLRRMYPSLRWIEHPSRNGLPGRHITVSTGSVLTAWQRIALQACMGSDPVRELLSACRIHRGDGVPTLFVEQAEPTP